MSKLVARIFHRMYPNDPKYSDNEEGDHLRRHFGVVVFLHIVFFVVSIVYIGFEAMLSEVFFGCLAYSCYLTLREPFIVFYLFGMTIAFLHGIYELTLSNYINPNNMFFFIADEVFYALVIWFITMSYLKFRRAGGIHGTLGTTKPPRPAKDLEKSKSTVKQTKQEQIKETLIQGEPVTISPSNVATPTPG